METAAGSAVRDGNSGGEVRAEDGSGGGSVPTRAAERSAKTTTERLETTASASTQPTLQLAATNTADGQDGSDSNEQHQDEGPEDTNDEGSMNEMTVVSADGVTTVQPTVEAAVTKIPKADTKRRVRRRVEPTNAERPLTRAAKRHAEEQRRRELASDNETKDGEVDVPVDDTEHAGSSLVPVTICESRQWLRGDDERRDHGSDAPE